MSDENGFFSDASDYSNDGGYSGYDPAPASESDPQPQQDQNQQPQSNAEVEQLRQKLAQQEQLLAKQQQDSQRWEQEFGKLREVFNPNPQQTPEQVQQQQALAEWEQRLQAQTSNAVLESVRIEMAEQQALSKYPELAPMADLIRSPQNVNKGFSEFFQKNGRQPQTAQEKVQCAVDAFINTTGILKNQTNGQGTPSNTIPLNVKSQTPHSQNVDLDNMTPEQFASLRSQTMAQHYR